jgi:hypothetical protein
MLVDHPAEVRLVVREVQDRAAHDRVHARVGVIETIELPDDEVACRQSGASPDAR